MKAVIVLVVIGVVLIPLIALTGANIDWGTVGYNALIGALTAGFFGGISAIFNIMKNRKKKRKKYTFSDYKIKHYQSGKDEISDKVISYFDSVT